MILYRIFWVPSIPMTPTRGADITVGYTIQNHETGLYLTEYNQTVVQLPANGSKAQTWTVEKYILSSFPLMRIIRNVGTGRQLVIQGDEPEVYDPANYIKEEENEWPEFVKNYGGDRSQVSVRSESPVWPSDILVNADFPEDGKGYYLYCVGHNRNGSLLEAEGGRVESQITDIPTQPDWLPYSKDITYTQNFQAEISASDADWDLLYDSQAADGILVGQPAGETNSYGIGFKHLTSELGVNKLSFDLMIPQAGIGYTVIGLRMNDYTDVTGDMTGIHLYIDKNGQIGIKYAGNSDSVTYPVDEYEFQQLSPCNH